MPLKADRNRCACRDDFEAFHRPFALPGGPMRVLGAVQIPRPPVVHRRHELAVGDLVAAQLVGDQHARHVPQALEQVGWPEGVAPSGSPQNRLCGIPHKRFDGRGLETERHGVTAPAPDPTLAWINMTGLDRQGSHILSSLYRLK